MLCRSTEKLDKITKWQNNLSSRSNYLLVLELLTISRCPHQQIELALKWPKMNCSYIFVYFRQIQTDKSGYCTPSNNSIK